MKKTKPTDEEILSAIGVIDSLAGTTAYSNITRATLIDALPVSKRPLNSEECSITTWITGPEREWTKGEADKLLRAIRDIPSIVVGKWTIDFSRSGLPEW